MAQAELFADEYKVDLDVFEKQKGLKQKGSDLIATGTPSKARQN